MFSNRLVVTLVLLGTLLLAGCESKARVGALQTKSETVELGDAESVRVEIIMGAGDLEVSGGAKELLEADFTYNVAKLEPQMEHTGDRVVVRQPEGIGLPALQGITGFRNEWSLRLNDDVPMDLTVDMGAGSSNLHLADLSLTRVNISLGASASGVIDLSGNWTRDLDVAIDAGAGNITVLLPTDVGVRVEATAGVGIIEAPGLTKDGGVYTNAAYGVSGVTLRVNLEAGIGHIELRVQEKAAATSDRFPVAGVLSQAKGEEAGITSLGVWREQQ